MFFGKNRAFIILPRTAGCWSSDLDLCRAPAIFNCKDTAFWRILKLYLAKLDAELIKKYFFLYNKNKKGVLFMVLSQKGGL